MVLEQLRFLEEGIVEELHANTSSNLKLYQQKNFEEMAEQPGWSIETKGVSIERNKLENLIPNSDALSEIENSLNVFSSMKGMTPALAREERIWVRLCHLECFEYAKERWIGTKDPERDIRIHFFARRLDQARDDNAIGRLWWNGYLAHRIDSSNPQRVLMQLLKRANIRLQFVDRANASFRLPLARGIVRLLEVEPWLNSHDKAFEHFMLVLDKNAGGVVFEALDDDEIDKLLSDNLPRARVVHKERVP